MPSTLIEAMVARLQRTAPFHGKPVMNRPLNTLWHWHEQTLLQLRQPLHHRYLRKPRPKLKVYDEAIQAGLAILAAFASETHVKQAIVRIGADNRLDAISFQPRPFAAAWNRTHAISPGALADAMMDPMSGAEVPRMHVADMIHLAGKVSLAIANKVTDDGDISGHATFEFNRNPNAPETLVLVTYRPHDTPQGAASRHFEMLIPSA
jgi:hypothetical protein